MTIRHGRPHAILCRRHCTSKTLSRASVRVSRRSGCFKKTRYQKLSMDCSNKHIGFAHGYRLELVNCRALVPIGSRRLLAKKPVDTKTPRSHAPVCCTADGRASFELSDTGQLTGFERRKQSAARETPRAPVVVPPPPRLVRPAPFDELRGE